MNKCKSCGLPKGKHKLTCCNNSNKQAVVYTDLEPAICRTKGCQYEIHRGSRCIDCWLERGGDGDGHRF